MTASQYLEGQILIAMPGIGDPRFDKSLIFLCAHSKSGAMGIIVNKTAPMMFFSDLVDQLKIVPPDEVRALAPPVLNLPVLFGGPVEQFPGSAAQLAKAQDAAAQAQPGAATTPASGGGQ